MKPSIDGNWVVAYWMPEFGCMPAGWHTSKTFHNYTDAKQFIRDCRKENDTTVRIFKSGEVPCT